MLVAYQVIENCNVVAQYSILTAVFDIASSTVKKEGRNPFRNNQCYVVVFLQKNKLSSFRAELKFIYLILSIRLS